MATEDTCRTQIRSPYARFALLCGVITASFGGLGLVSWVTGFHHLASIRSHYIPMAPSSALAFLFLGGALVLRLQGPSCRLGRFGAVAASLCVLCVSLLILVGFFSRLDIGLEEVLIRDPRPFGATLTGRMSPITALGFLLTSVALLLLLSPARPATGKAAALASFVAVANLVVLLGYFYGAPLLYGGEIIPVAATTALSFLCFGAGLIAVAGPEHFPLRPFVGSSTRALLLRAFLPPVIVTVLLGDLLSPLIVWPATHPALQSALTVLVSAVAVCVVAALVARTIGDAIDRAETARKQNAILQAEIAERQRAEAALRTYAEEIHDLYNNAPCGYHSLDQDGVFVRINDTELAWLGYARDEVVGKVKFTDLITAESRQVFQQHFPILKTRGWVNDLEFDLIRKDGTILPVLLNATAVRDDDGRFLMSRSSVFDLTALKRAEEKQRQSEELYRTLTKNFPNGAVLLFDRNLRYTLAEGTGLAEVGLSTEQLEQKTIWEIFPPETCAAIEPYYRAALAGTVASFEVPYTGRVYLVHTLPIRDKHGEIFAGMAMTQDITERKEAERLKDEFVSTVSHELRTPLTSLRGFAELMLTRDFPPEKRREFLTIIHSESVRLTNLINDFLDLQRIQSGRQTYQFDRIEVAPLLQESLAVFRRENGKHAFRLAVSDPLPVVRADAARVRQVLANLLSNAVKFSPHGGTITVGAQREGAHVMVWVADQGVGIPPEALPKLFGKFFRVDNTEARSIGGTGLGLALVKDIIEAHGGRVWVESEPGKGSTFFFTLPRAEPVAPVQAIPQQGAVAEAPDIVLVEDDPAYARLLQEHFLSAGLRVTTTARAEEALDLVRRAAPRLVLTDIHLAGRLDGWDLLVELKNDPTVRAIPVLIISSSAEASVRGLALAGADYLLKPVGPDPNGFLQAIRQRLVTLSGRRVLVADDDMIFRRRVKRWLVAEGVTVEEATDGREALACIAQRVPDLLLLDLLMPEVDGFEVLRQLRTDKRAMNLPVLVVTGKDLGADEKTYLKQKLATLVSKKEASLDYFARVIGQVLKT